MTVNEGQRDSMSSYIAEKPTMVYITYSPEDILVLDTLFNTMLVQPLPRCLRSGPNKGGYLGSFYKAPGFLKKRMPWLPDKLLYALGSLLDCTNNIPIRASENVVDIVFNASLRRYKLDRYRRAIHIHWSYDCINPSRFYTSLFTTKAHHYDIVLVAHRACIERYRDYGINARFYTFYVNPLVYRRRGLQKRYDIVFVGSLDEKRKRILYLLRQKLGGDRVVVVEAWGQNASRVYNMAKIVLNISRMGEINQRVFEALGSGSFLLTDYSSEVREFFEDGKHLVFYHDAEELVEKARYYLRDEEEREQIARQGYEEAVKRHTLFDRMLSLLEYIAGTRKAMHNPRISRLVKMLPRLHLIRDHVVGQMLRLGLYDYV